MKNRVEKAEIEDAIRGCVERCSAHLIDLLVRGTRGSAVVEVFIDTEEGVTSDLCSLVSHDVARLIDRSGWFQGTYRLDVSSPGIDRPLRYPWQYKKHIGRLLGIRTRASGGGAQRSGRLTAVRENGIMIAAKEGSPEELVLFNELTEAVVRTPW